MLLIENKVSPEECIFLDLEVFRKEVRSVGQHMVMFRKDSIPANWENFRNSIQANNLRGFDFKVKFGEKYPLATIHLLLAIAGFSTRVKISEKAAGILLYTDGTFKNLFNYPENCLSWFKFLGVDQPDSALHKVFFGNNTISEIMLELKSFFAELAAMNDGKRGADKIKLTSKIRGEIKLVGAEKHGDLYRLTSQTARMAEAFLNLASDLTGWELHRDFWRFDGLKLKQFTKNKIVPTQGRYFDLMAQNPISFAITSGQDLEYTLEGPDQFLG